MLGKTVIIDGVSEDVNDIPLYRIDHETYDFWYEDELEPSKEHKVLEILRNYEKSRNNMG